MFPRRATASFLVGCAANDYDPVLPRDSGRRDVPNLDREISNVRPLVRFDVVLLNVILVCAPFLFVVLPTGGVNGVVEKSPAGMIPTLAVALKRLPAVETGGVARDQTL